MVVIVVNYLARVHQLVAVTCLTYMYESKNELSCKNISKIPEEKWCSSDCTSGIILCPPDWLEHLFEVVSSHHRKETLSQGSSEERTKEKTQKSLQKTIELEQNVPYKAHTFQLYMLPKAFK